MINLFENFRSVVNDSKAKSTLGVDVNESRAKSNLAVDVNDCKAKANLDVDINGSKEKLTLDVDVSGSSARSAPDVDVKDGKFKSNVDIDVNSNSTELRSSNVFDPPPKNYSSSSVVTDKTARLQKRNESKHQLTASEDAKLRAVPPKDPRKENSYAKTTRSSASTKKTVELFVDNAPMEAGGSPRPFEFSSSSSSSKTCSNSVTLKTEVDEIDSDKIDKIVGCVDKNESVGRVDKNESIGRVDKNESVGRIEKNESVGCVDKNESVGRVDKNESIGLVNKDGSVGLVNEDGIVGLVHKDEGGGLVDKDEGVGLVDEDEGAGCVDNQPPYLSSSSESAPSEDRPEESGLDSAASKTRPSCNTCDYLDAPVDCRDCCRAYCKNCSVTPSPEGLPWSCFLCQLEATRRPKVEAVRQLRSRKRDSPAPEPLPAKRRRSNVTADARPSSSVTSSSSSSSSVASSSTATSRDASLDSSALESEGSHALSMTSSPTSSSGVTRQLECTAIIAGNKTIEIKFQPRRTTMIYGKGVAENAGERGGRGGGIGSAKSSPSLESMEERMMEVEDPVIVVDQDNATMEAEDEAEKDDDEDEEDEEEEEEEDEAETRLAPLAGDSQQTLAAKLSQALERIRKLKAKKRLKEEETKRVRRRLAWTRAHLETAEKNLVDVVAAGSKGRSTAGVAPPGISPPPPKPSPNMVPWTQEEVEALREAVADCGPGQWKNIYDKYKDRFNPLRTRFNIRDRYKLMKSKKLW